MPPRKKPLESTHQIEMKYSRWPSLCFFISKRNLDIAPSSPIRQVRAPKDGARVRRRGNALISVKRCSRINAGKKSSTAGSPDGHDWQKFIKASCSPAATSRTVVIILPGNGRSSAPGRFQTPTVIAASNAPKAGVGIAPTDTPA